MTPSAGETHAFDRTFTKADVRQFTELSGDAGDHHVEENADGQLLVQGLLTATLPTKVGGEFDVLARRMTFHFRRPVWTGEEVHSEVTFETVAERPDGNLEVEAVFDCTRESEPVLQGTFEGLIRQ
ncbi:dehydratase [Natronomonas sp. EA1]|uniref:dehydratase n=1 Tax=Natronomonas sp. EA1 TaxID=3421655 RepID=UPI003EBC3265